MTLRHALVLAAALAAGGLAHFALERLGRRLPLWLARRRGAALRPDLAPPRGVALLVLALQIAAWGAAAYVASEQFAAIRAVRGEAAALFARSLRAPLFALDDRPYSAVDLLVLPALVIAVWIAVSALTRLVRTQVLASAGFESGAQETLSVLLRYALAFVGTIVVLQAWGVDLRTFAILASVLGVGIGFGLQNIANNFVSGVLISVERPIRPGDFVRVGEFLGTVQRVGARSTEIRTLDRVTILVPNSRFLESEVVNWSHGDPLSRVHVPIGVAYGSDLHRVRHALLEVARAHPAVVQEPRPQVQLRQFGESSVDLELLVWTRDPMNQFTLISDLNFQVAESLRRHGIQIPFPQRDLNLPDSVERAVEAWTRRHFPEAEAAAEAAAEAGADLGRDAAHQREAPVERGVEAWTEQELAALVEKMRGPMGVEVADRRWLLTVHRRCFVGSEAVDWLATNGGLTRSEAVSVGERLVRLGRVRHVLDEHGFRDGRFFFRFREDEGGTRGL